MKTINDVTANAMLFSLKTDIEIQQFFEDDNQGGDDEKCVPKEEESDKNVKESQIDEKSMDQLTDIRDISGDSKRSFGKLEPGSLRSSIFNMIILSFGSGCLSLPKIMGEMSLMMGLIAIFFTSLATYSTLYMVSSTSEKYKIFNYSKLTRMLFGNVVGFILDFTILFYIFGGIILMQVVSKIFLNLNFLVYKFIGEVVYNLGEFYQEYDDIESFRMNSFWSETKVNMLVMYGITFFIFIPLCAMKDVSKLRIASLLGVFTVVFLISMIVIQSPFYIQHYWDYVYKEYDKSTHLNVFNIASGFDSNLFFFQGTATLFYSFSCHLGSFPIFNSLKNNVMRRVHKVIISSIFVDTILFIIISISGYLTWPINTPSLIIERDNIAGGMDVIMSIGKIAFITVLILKFPSVFNSFRISFFELVFGDSKITNKR
jgi:amino acid permease